MKELIVLVATVPLLIGLLAGCGRPAAEPASTHTVAAPAAKPAPPTATPVPPSSPTATLAYTYATPTAAKLRRELQEVTFFVPGCGECDPTLLLDLEDTPGIYFVSVTDDDLMTIDYDPNEISREELILAIEKKTFLEVNKELDQ